MRMEIIDILLQECYVMKDSGFGRSRILIEKGKVLRALGLAQLDECIKSLAEAILELVSYVIPFSLCATCFLISYGSSII